MRLDDPALDSMASQTRDGLLLETLRGQIAFMRETVPYWRERLATEAIDESKIESMADLASLPIMSKEDLRSVRPSELLPEPRPMAWEVCRWTSGTSGRPTVNFWSGGDWARW